MIVATSFFFDVWLYGSYLQSNFTIGGGVDLGHRYNVPAMKPSHARNYFGLGVWIANLIH